MRLDQFQTTKITQLPLNKYRQLLTQPLIKLYNAFVSNGYELRIVGGTPRDIMLGIEPKDIDLATTATPQQMIELLDNADIRYEPTGLQHGTITAILAGEPFEITTLRIDTNQDGRHADVEFTKDWKVDAERRDLTFNAMSLDFDGKLYDYFGGVQDLRNNVAKFVGDADARLKEDYLRILRYFRFQSRLSTISWDQDTLDAIENNVDGLKSISGERIWAELSKILSQPNNVHNIIELMDVVSVLPAIGIPNNRLHKFKQVVSSDPVVMLSALIDNERALDTINNRLKLSKKEFTTARFIIANRDNQFDETIAKGMLVDQNINNDQVVALADAVGKSDVMKKLTNWQVPIFPVTGADLITKGIEPGPNFGVVLNSLRRKWKESGFVLSKDELLRHL